jgi:aerobic carbon-monoxide dehydrogenase medium subunit
MLPPFAIQRPRSASDAIGLLSEDSTAYFGGTELLLAMKMGLLRPRVLVDLKRIEELRGIGIADGQLVIGAGVTHAEVASSELVQDLVPVLAEAEARVGNARVRAQGSIGGNLCFAEPRSDITTVLCALGASVVLRSRSGSRTLPVPEFLLGPYWTERQDDELMLHVAIPLPAPDGSYLKYQTSERPVVGVAAVRAGDSGVRLAIGAVTELPVCREFADLEQVDVEALVADLDPVADLAGSVTYKRHVTGVYVRRAMRALLTTAR